MGELPRRESIPGYSQQERLLSVGRNLLQSAVQLSSSLYESMELERPKTARSRLAADSELCRQQHNSLPIRCFSESRNIRRSKFYKRQLESAPAPLSAKPGAGAILRRNLSN